LPIYGKSFSDFTGTNKNYIFTRRVQQTPHNLNLFLILYWILLFKKIYKIRECF